MKDVTLKTNINSMNSGMINNNLDTDDSGDIAAKNDVSYAISNSENCYDQIQTNLKIVEKIISECFTINDIEFGINDINDIKNKLNS